MIRNRLARTCRTTVLTLASASLRMPSALPAWVKIKTGSPDFGLLTVPDFGIMDADDASVIAGDILATALRNEGTRLIPYVDRDVEPLLSKIAARLPHGAEGRVCFEPSYEIPRSVTLDRSTTLVVGCMDDRLHRGRGMFEALGTALGEDASGFDLLATDGGGGNLGGLSKRGDMVRRQIVGGRYRRVILLSHADCVQYGGKDAFTGPAHEHAKLGADLHDAARRLAPTLPRVAFRLGIVHLSMDRFDRITLE